VAEGTTGASPAPIASRFADAAAPTETTATAPARQVAEALAARLPEAPARFEIALEPRELGRVEVRLEVQGERVHLALVAERTETRDLLAAGLGELRDALHRGGFELTDAQVFAESGGRRERYLPLEEERAAPPAENGPREPEAPPPRPVPPAHGVDIHI
jgi:flagellar hook-length control protein FliK